MTPQNSMAKYWSVRQTQTTTQYQKLTTLDGNQRDNERNQSVQSL